MSNLPVVSEQTIQLVEELFDNDPNSQMMKSTIDKMKLDNPFLLAALEVIFEDEEKREYGAGMIYMYHLLHLQSKLDNATMQ